MCSAPRTPSHNMQSQHVFTPHAIPPHAIPPCAIPPHAWLECALPTSGHDTPSPPKSQVNSGSRSAPLQSKRFHSIRAFCNTMFAASTCSSGDKGVPAKLALGTDIPQRALALVPCWFLYMICQKPTDWLEACVRQAIFPCSDSVSNSPNVAAPSPR